MRVTVNNVAPEPEIGGLPAGSPEGAQVNVSASATDSSNADMEAGLSYGWSVTKDGLAFATTPPAAAIASRRRITAHTL